MYRAVTLCGLFFMALTPYFANAMSEEQKARIREHFETIGMQCITDNPITEQDINDLRGKKPPSGAGAPCFLACVMRNIGVMDDAGMLQKESVLELAKKVFEDEEELKIIADYLHSCSSVNSASVGDGAKGCERAMLAYTCMIENAPKFGIDV
uniref:Odorant-binding protein 13 n=1 Tax=Cnaphalocrocis medinalis TaxID=437488 RepID=A0A0U3AKI1_CNAME|nr:odorant-binding protein 13 [Cnaphalocrocis medinalis]